MTQVFISYSSVDEARAKLLRHWLRGIGCTNLFLASHAEDGIRAGEQWRDALREAGKKARVVLLLVSPAWLASKECDEEFKSAELLNRNIVPVLIDPAVRDSLPSRIKNLHLVDLSTESDEDRGYQRLRRELRRTGCISGERPRVELPIFGWLLLAATVGGGSYFLAGASKLTSGPTVGATCDDSNYHDVMQSPLVSAFDQNACNVSYLCTGSVGETRQIAIDQYCNDLQEVVSNAYAMYLSGGRKALENLKAHPNSVFYDLPSGIGTAKNPIALKCDVSLQPWARFCKRTLDAT